MVKKRKDDAKVLAEQVSDWASIHGQVDDPYVASLVADLYKKRNLAMWATINPMEMLPYSRQDNVNRKLEFGKYVSIARNILVFAPVGITWKGVEEATKAFSKFVETNSASTVNFLEFWQNGYGVLPEAWTIGNVAKFDYFLIILIILLSIIATILIESGKKLRSRNAVSIEADRTYLALEIQKYLYSKRAINDVTMNASLSDSIQNLENSTQSLQSAIYKLEQASKKHPTDLNFRSEYKDFFKRLNSALSKKEKS